MEVGAIEISTGPSSIERRVGAACAVAKWKMGVLGFFTNKTLIICEYWSNMESCYINCSKYQKVIF